MLLELRARALGVIEELDLVLEPGLTVLSGETGAGKTLVVDALELLLGGRAGPELVRSGSKEALVEGRFSAPADLTGAGAGDSQLDGDLQLAGEREIVLCRVVPLEGRSRSYLDGRMSTAGALGEIGEVLVDLYGQHTQQSLLRPMAQREALDHFAGLDLGDWRSARAEVRELERQIAALGHDAEARRREAELLSFQIEEIARAAVVSPREDEILAEEEEVLAAASTLKDAAARAYALLSGTGSFGTGSFGTGSFGTGSFGTGSFGTGSYDQESLGAGITSSEGAGSPGAIDLVGSAAGALRELAPLSDVLSRLDASLVELGDLASELRRLGEAFEEDPERLEQVRERRHLLHGLCRKYGPTLEDVLEVQRAGSARLLELGEGATARETLEEARGRALRRLAVAEDQLGSSRRCAAPALAAAVEAHLGELALGGARVEVEVSGGRLGDEIDIRLAANPGEAFVPLARAASGGELSRVMLAMRLVLSQGPPTYVFDEVDAGIGGATGVVVGRALAQLASSRQVVVVTHLAQVAAFADHHLRVVKHVAGGRTATEVETVAGEARIAELSRMLSGHPESEAARAHARELVAEVAAWRAHSAAGSRARPRGTQVSTTASSRRADANDAVHQEDEGPKTAVHRTRRHAQ